MPQSDNSMLKELIEMQKMIVQLNSENLSLKEQLGLSSSKYEDEKTRHEVEIDFLKHEIEHTKETLTQKIQTKLREATKKIAMLNIKNAELSKELQAKKNEEDHSQQSTTYLTANEDSDLAKQVEKLHLDLAQSNEAISKLKTEKQELIDTLQLTGQERDDCLEKLQYNDSLVALLQNKIRDIEGENSMLKVETDHFQNLEQAAHFSASESASQHQIASLQARINQLEAALSSTANNNSCVRPIPSNPNQSVSELKKLSTQFYARRQYSESIKYLLEAARIEEATRGDRSMLGSLWHKVALCYYEVGRMQDAFDAANTSIYFHSKEPTSRYMRALVLVSMGNTRMAIDDLKCALKIRPHYPEASILLSNIKH